MKDDVRWNDGTKPLMPQKAIERIAKRYCKSKSKPNYSQMNNYPFVGFAKECGPLQDKYSQMNDSEFLKFASNWMKENPGEDIP